MKQTAMSTTLRKELQDYLFQLESHVFSEDIQSFDITISRLIDAVRFLLEAGNG